MGRKNKRGRWAELEQMDFVFQPPMEEVFGKDFRLKGHWSSFFGNTNPIILELGCGKGEYTTGLARKYPEKNFIGVDIKGARMWRGAKTSKEEGLKNVAFLRTRIEWIGSFFGTGEVDEIWITFPDPQLKKRRTKKRLTHPVFLEQYRKFIKPVGLIHLKTDNAFLYNYTLEVAQYNKLDIRTASDDVYREYPGHLATEIQTFYEQQFLEEGKKIHYLSFSLPENGNLEHPPDEE